MDLLSFLAALVDSLAWPALVIVLLIIGRREVRQLLQALLRFRYKDLELEFGKRVQEVGERIEDQAELLLVPPGAPPGVEPPPPGTAPPGPPDIHGAEVNEWDVEPLVGRLAPVSPRAAIAEAWRDVEHALLDLAREGDLDSSASPGQLTRMLVSHGLISGSTVSVLDDLRTLRNEALHQRELALSTQEALEYAEVAKRLARQLRMSRWSS